MMAVKIELEEKKRTNDLLQRALVSKKPQRVLQLACRTGVIFLGILSERGEYEARVARGEEREQKYFAFPSFSSFIALKYAKLSPVLQAILQLTFPELYNEACPAALNLHNFEIVAYIFRPKTNTRCWTVNMISYQFLNTKLVHFLAINFNSFFH